MLVWLISFRQGQVDESIKYLQRFIQVSEESEDDTALSVACNSLGIRLNCLVCIVTTSTDEKTMWCRHIVRPSA